MSDKKPLNRSDYVAPHESVVDRRFQAERCLQQQGGKIHAPDASEWFDGYVLPTIA